MSVRLSVVTLSHRDHVRLSANGANGGGIAARRVGRRSATRGRRHRNAAAARGVHG